MVSRAVVLMAFGLLLACGTPAERARTRVEPPPIAVHPVGIDRRQVTHAAGDTIITAHPQRIAALAFEDEVLALGFRPCAFITTFGFTRPYAASALAGSRPITPLYGAMEPPLEAVLATSPDLILASGITSSHSRGLSAIAPTVVLGESTGPDSDKRRLRDVAKVLGSESRAEQIISDYESRLREARQLLAKRFRGETVAVLRVRARKYNLFGAGLTIPVLYDELGLRPPSLVKTLLLDKKRESMVLDPELLPDLAVDHLFVIINPQLASDRHTSALEEISLWKQVPAVVKGQVYYVSQTNWMSRGIIARSVVADEVVAALFRQGRFFAPADSPQARLKHIEAAFENPSPVTRGQSLSSSWFPHDGL